MATNYSLTALSNFWRNTSQSFQSGINMRKSLCAGVFFLILSSNSLDSSAISISHWILKHQNSAKFDDSECWEYSFTKPEFSTVHPCPLRLVCICQNKLKVVGKTAPRRSLAQQTSCGFCVHVADCRAATSRGYNSPPFFPSLFPHSFHWWWPDCEADPVASWLFCNEGDIKSSQRERFWRHFHPGKHKIA